MGFTSVGWNGHAWVALTVREAEPHVVRTVDPGLTCLSGVAFYGGGIWAVEYGENRLVRVAGTLTRGR